VQANPAGAMIFLLEFSLYVNAQYYYLYIENNGGSSIICFEGRAELLAI
jgi:hypothetical protein